MWRHLGRLNCVCRPYPPLNSICSVRSHAASIIKQPANNCSLTPPSAPPSAPPFIAPSATRTLRFRPPLLRRSNQKNNKAVKVALLFTSTPPPSPPDSSGRSASVREVECWSTLVDQPRNASNTSSVFRCMLLKQTPVCCNSF